MAGHRQLPAYALRSVDGVQGDKLPSVGDGDENPAHQVDGRDLIVQADFPPEVPAGVGPAGEEEVADLATGEVVISAGVNETRSRVVIDEHSAATEDVPSVLPVQWEDGTHPCRSCALGWLGYRDLLVPV